MGLREDREARTAFALWLGKAPGEVGRYTLSKVTLNPTNHPGQLQDPNLGDCASRPVLSRQTKREGKRTPTHAQVSTLPSTSAGTTPHQP